jgi:hypothetical protein
MNKSKMIYPVTKMHFNDSEGYRTIVSADEPIELPDFLLPLHRAYEFQDYLGPTYVETWYVFETRAEAEACTAPHYDAICEPGDKPYFKMPELTDEWNEIVPYKQFEQEIGMS